MATAGRVHDQQLDVTGLPCSQARLAVELPSLGKPGPDPVVVVDVCREAQDRLALVDDLLQRVQLCVVYVVDQAQVVVDRAVGHLTQLASQDGHIGRSHLAADHGRFHLVVTLAVERDLDHVVDPLRQGDSAVDADHHVLDRLLDFVPGTRLETPGVDRLAVALVRQIPPVPILCDPGAQPLASVHDADLCPQIQQIAVRVRRTGQDVQPLDLGPDAFQRLPSLTRPVLKSPVLVDHHALERPNQQLVDQPSKVLPVDHVNVSRCSQCLSTLPRTAQNALYAHFSQVVPLTPFRVPNKLCDPFWRNHQGLHPQLFDHGQGCRCLSGTHAKRDQLVRLGQHPLLRLNLRRSRQIFHRLAPLNQSHERRHPVLATTYAHATGSPSASCLVPSAPQKQSGPAKTRSGRAHPPSLALPT